MNCNQQPLLKAEIPRANLLSFGSTGASSVILVGDMIYSYAGDRVFDPGSLYILSADGLAGENVEVIIMRDGSLIQLWVSRRPVGARVDHIRVPPCVNQWFST